ncbi:hypothetical protein Bbelb_141600 [Branchiostoma belcheri]|nr:hypothetical protein Bbelb_141600 [Branchiostoma belcheri]
MSDLRRLFSKPTRWFKFTRKGTTLCIVQVTVRVTPISQALSSLLISVPACFRAERAFCNDADRTIGPRALLFHSYTGDLAAIVVPSRLFYRPHGKPPTAGHTSVRPSGNGKLTAVATGEAERSGPGIVNTSFTAVLGAFQQREPGIR